MAYELTVLDWICLLVVAGVGIAMLLEMRKADSGHTGPLIMVGRVGRDVAILAWSGDNCKLQIERYYGVIEPRTLIGIIQTDGSIQMLRAVEQSRTVAHGVIHVKCKATKIEK